MVNDIAVQEFVKAIKEEPQDTNKTYNATVSRVDGEGVVWVNIHGSDKETPTSSTSTEVKRGDSVTVNWRNNKLYIGGNYSNPSAGIGTVAPSVNYVNDLIDKDISVASINAAAGYIGDLTADNITTENIKATNGYIQHLVADDITAEDISASSGYIKDLTSENITAENIIADHETVGSLDANYAHITNGVIDNAKIGYADVNNLNAHYAEIDLANVDNAWIEDGLIKDAAITDAKILGVSANKLTAGTIDASNITVTNLNASNITTGSITVDGITIDVENNEASIDGEYIEDGTITMNGLAQEVKDVIDGAIETYTGTVVPTLNNAPANAWTTTKLKDQHIGDVYYVVNSSSQQNGYCYRFSKSGSTYSWQLIKDSDVTAALQRLQTAEGKISNIESFDEEMATFKTETEGDISTLQTKTTSLETSLGDKVDKSTFNEVKQTVDGNSASITELSTITTNNGLTKTTNITNTVNTVSQTATGNSSKISSLTQTLGTNADGTTKDGDIIHQVSQIDQDLDGVTTRVSKTEVKLAGQYATSSTGAGTTAKVATITPAVIGWTLYTGATVTVKFSTANTATTPTLNVNSTGAKTIKGYKGAALTEKEYKWAANDAITFIYDGTNWLMQSSSTEATRLSTAEASITTNAGNIALKANASDVYTKTAANALLEVKANKDTLTSEINASADTVKINANRVQIDGTATFNAIKSSADAAYDSIGSASAVQTNLDNLEIGGRNLVWDTEWKNLTARWTNWGAPPTREIVTVNSKRCLHLVTNTTMFQGYSQGQEKRNGYGEIKAGDKVVVSLFAHAAVANQKASIGIHWRNSSGTIVSQNWGTWSLTTTAQRYTSPTFTVPDGATGFNIMIGDNTDVAQELWISEVKMEFGNKATDWSPAPEDSLAEEQRIYYRSDSTSTPSAPSTWVTSTSTANSTWTTKRMQYDSTYKYLYTCIQKKTAGGNVTNSTVLLDDTTTVIDGGNIITGTVTANQLSANAVTADKIAIGAIDEYENILLDSDAPTLTKVKAPYDRYFSDGGNNKIVCSNFTLTDAPEQGLKYGRRFVYDGSVATNNYLRAYAFYYANDNAIPLVPNQTYTATWWARCTSGSGRTQFYYSKGDGATGTVSGTIYTLTSYWKKYTYSFTFGSALNTNYNRIWFRALFPTSTAGTVEICGCKLTVGADAESYITRIDNNGIRIHPSSTENNSVVINSDGMEVYQEGTSVAHYGDYARVGKDGEANTTISPNQVTISASDNINALRITPDGNTQTVYHSITRGYLIEAGKVYTFTQPSAIPSGTTTQYKLLHKSHSLARFEIKKGTSKSTTSVTTPFPFQYSATTTEVTIKNTGSAAFSLYSIDYSTTEVSPLTEVGGVLALGQYPSIGTHDVLTVGYGSSSSTASCFSVTNYGLVSCRELAIQENNMPISLAITDGTRIDALSADASNNLILGRGWWAKNTSGYNTYVEGYETNIWGRNKIATNMAITQGSDKRLKKDIKDLEDVKDFVMDLKPVEFKYEFANDKAKHLGFIAQDVEKSMDAYGLSSDKYGLTTEITGTDNIQYKGLNYTEFIPICIKMIQEQQQEIDTLKEVLNEVLGN